MTKQIIVGNERTEIILSKAYNGLASAQVHHRAIFDSVASQAAQFLEKWALVACMEDGETSNGRQRFRLPTPQEVVKRAFDIAEAFDAEATARGTKIKLASFEQITALELEDA